MQNNFENLGQLKNFINSLSEDELKQPLRFWGEEIGGRISSAEILNDDYINPSGEGVEPRSPYLPGGEYHEPGEDYQDEPIVIQKGTVMFWIDGSPDHKKHFEKCPTCLAPVNIRHTLPKADEDPFTNSEPNPTRKVYEYAGK